MATAHESGAARAFRRETNGAWALVAIAALVLACGSPPVDSPPVDSPPDAALFEMDGQDLVIGAQKVRVKHLPASMGDDLYLATDEALVVAADGITIADLQAIAHEAPRDPKNVELLLKIFNEYGVSMSYLPRGYSAGRGAAIDLSDRVDASNALEHLTGSAWFGKYFERPDECRRTTRGANRIGKHARVDFVARLIPQDRIASYVTDPESLDIHARSNYVDLDYKSTQPGKRRTSLDEPNTHTDDNFPVLSSIAGLVERLGVYDLCVVIPGRHGPILVGRTWLGEYADNTEETYTASSLDGKQIAWFFLDFSEAALAQQDSTLSPVEYSPKSSCERRTVASEAEPLPAPRPL